MAGKVSFNGKRELRWLQVGGCFVTYMDADVEFADALWEQWLAALEQAPGGTRLLCSWGDIQPSKPQWRQATRLMKKSGKKFAVVTESRHTSALAKAASWLGIEMQAFRWEQLYDASVFLGLEREERMAVRAQSIALRDRFGPVAGDAELGPTARPAAPAPSRSSSFETASKPSRGSAFESTSKPSRSSAFESSRTPARDSGAGTSPRMNGAHATETSSIAAAASESLARVRQTSEEIQAKLEQIQARLRNRAPINPRSRE